MSDGPRGLERNHPQVLTSELAAPVDANTPNLLPDEQHVECLQKCASLTKNDKNKGVSELVSEGISGLEEMAEMCRARGVTMVVVQMPVMKAYKEALPKEQVAMQDSVLRALGGKAVYIDASEWEIPADGWYNATHLTREASAEFTKKLRDVVI